MFIRNRATWAHIQQSKEFYVSWRKTEEYGAMPHIFKEMSGSKNISRIYFKQYSVTRIFISTKSKQLFKIVIIQITTPITQSTYQVKISNNQNVEIRHK